MAYPAGWPPRQSSTTRPLRFFKKGTTTAAFDANAYLFGTDAAGQPTQAANVSPLPFVAPGSTAAVSVPATPQGGGRNVNDAGPGGAGTPVPHRFAGTIRITNDSTSTSDILEFSFDGTNVHGEVRGGESITYRDRHESGICVKTGAGTASPFRIEAW